LSGSQLGGFLIFLGFSIPGNVKLYESPGRAGGLPKGKLISFGHTTITSDSLQAFFLQRVFHSGKNRFAEEKFMEWLVQYFKNRQIRKHMKKRIEVWLLPEKIEEALPGAAFPVKH
jgi:hypothetical protein